MKNKIMIWRFILAILFFVLGILFPSFNIYFFLLSYFIMSYDIYVKVVKNILKLDFFDEGFLMIIATIGAICIGELEEAVMVFFLYQIGEYFGDKAVDDSKKSIIDLLSLKSKVAHLKTEDSLKDIPLEKIKKDDLLIIKKGETIPVDGIITFGHGNIDTSSLTGESVYKLRGVGDSILSGSINVDDVLEIKAEKKYEDSTIYRMLKMVQESEEKKTKSERFITKFAKIYTPIVVLIAFLIVVIPYLLGWDGSKFLYRALVFLVISCPCALVISVPLSFFCGIGAASRKGILFKGSNELEEISKCNTILLDKTGTLTKGNFIIKEILGDAKEEVLKYAAYAEYYSIHPIASVIKQKYSKKIEMKDITDYEEIAGMGVTAKIKTNQVLVGNEKLMQQYQISCPKITDYGTHIIVAKNKKYLGTIIIQDEIKETTFSAISKLRNKNLNFCILSGDEEKSVKEVANQLKISEFHASLLPEEKLSLIKEFQQKTKTIFIGDGINDALALKQSDIGISMGGVGSDVAIEASDVVFMTDDLEKLNTAFSISKRTRRIVWQNILFSLTVKLIVMLLGIFGIANMWLAVFSDVGVTFLAILNALRIFYQK